MGLEQHGEFKLASADLDVPFIRWPVIRLESQGPPRVERPAPRGQYCAAFPAVAKDDRRALAQLSGGGLIRTASIKGGISRLGFRKKRRVEHVLLAAHDLGLHPLCKNCQL